ncbi:MAG: hypothetical protein Q4E24_16395 [bacterium]|nr:hypothetical protein [bacterium]
MGNKGIKSKKAGIVFVLLAMAVTAWLLVACVVQMRAVRTIDGIYWNVVLYEAMILVEGYLILWLISDKKYKKFRKNIVLHERMEKKE